MRFELVSTVSAALALQASVASASLHTHDHLHAHSRKHQHHNRLENTSRAETGGPALELRAPDDGGSGNGGSGSGGSGGGGGGNGSGQCTFPPDAGLVPITPGEANAGWAMTYNQPCLPGNWCPIACPPGQVMNQWDPKATKYEYPESMNGGLFCDSNGQISKPFPNEPYCVPGTGVAEAVDQTGKGVAFCQTVLPGNENMLIPTWVTGTTTLAIPGPDYWCGTSAEFYINEPGLSTDTACCWGSNQNPWGNWAPYVAGGNTLASGDSFLMLGWNPIWLEPATPFRNTVPDFGVEIICEGGDCNGLPCSIDPSKNGVNEMTGGQGGGAGGAQFCVITVPKGVTAKYIVFEGSPNADNSGSSPGSSAAPASSNQTPTPAPTPSGVPTSSAAASSTPTAAGGSSSLGSYGKNSTRPSGTISPYMPHILLENGTAVSMPTNSSSAAPLTTTPASSTGAVSPISSPSPSASASYRINVTAAGLSLSFIAALFAIAL